MAKIILTTGGTGGHIFPAIAVAQALLEKGCHDLLFVGGTYGPEGKQAARAGLKFSAIPARGFLGKGLKSLPSMLSMAAAIMKARKILADFKPDIVAGFGGYASFAPMLAAIMKGIPTVLHEQNAIAGASNRFLGKFASGICVSLPNTIGFSRQTVVTGNPVRGEIAAIGQKCVEKRGAKRLLVLGGSQGAHALNVFMPKILPALGDVEIKHQCGEKDLQATRAAYAEQGRSPQCAVAFIEDMAEAYEWADLVFCRAGASTIAELCAAGLPAVLTPFPAAIHDHQTFNARAMADAGAAMLVPQEKLDVSQTAELLLGILKEETRRKDMGEAARRMARPDAARFVAAEIEKHA